jgi:hypothetical protein
LILGGAIQTAGNQRTQLESASSLGTLKIVNSSSAGSGDPRTANAILGCATENNPDPAIFAQTTSMDGTAFRALSTSVGGIAVEIDAGNGKPLYIVPATTMGAPAKGRVGEFFVDSTSALFYCVNDNPVTWQDLSARAPGSPFTVLSTPVRAYDSRDGL